MTKKVSNARIHSYMCMFSENDKVNLVTQRNYDKKRHKSCVSEFTLASCGSEMVVASFRGREFYDFHTLGDNTIISRKATLNNKRIPIYFLRTAVFTT